MEQIEYKKNREASFLREEKRREEKRREEKRREEKRREEKRREEKRREGQIKMKEMCFS